MTEIRNFTLRIEKDQLAKFRYLSKLSGRSANSQILVMIRKVIDQFEQQNGEIDIADS